MELQKILNSREHKAIKMVLGRKSILQMSEELDTEVFRVNVLLNRCFKKIALNALGLKPVSVNSESLDCMGRPRKTTVFMDDGLTD